MPSRSASAALTCSALKAELEAAQAREATLRDQLQERSHAYEQNVGSEKELAHRALTLDERDAKLAEFQAELEERERRVRDQREAIEAEHTRVADLQAELAAEQALAAEHQEAAEKRLRDLQGADRQREKASTELSKARAALDDREQKVGAQGKRGRHARAGRDGQARRPRAGARPSARTSGGHATRSSRSASAGSASARAT